MYKQEKPRPGQDQAITEIPEGWVNATEAEAIAKRGIDSLNAMARAGRISRKLLEGASVFPRDELEKLDPPRRGPGAVITAAEQKKEKKEKLDKNNPLQWISLQEVMDITARSLSWVYSEKGKQLVRRHKFGGTYKFAREDVEALRLPAVAAGVGRRKGFKPKPAKGKQKSHDIVRLNAQLEQEARRPWQKLAMDLAGQLCAMLRQNVPGFNLATILNEGERVKLKIRRLDELDIEDA